MLYDRKGMKAKKNNAKLIIFLILLLAIFVALTTLVARQTFSGKKANENLSEIDYYSMQAHSNANVKLVTEALKSGKADKLKGKMKNTEGIDAVIEFADWGNADFKHASSLGTGSLSAKPDANGLMDVSERLFVDIEGVQYVLFVETVTSRWGRDNDGISAIAATSLEHFEALDYGWNGDPDDQSVLAGSLFWTGNQQTEEPENAGESETDAEDAKTEEPAAAEGADKTEEATE